MAIPKMTHDRHEYSEPDEGADVLLPGETWSESQSHLRAFDGTMRSLAANYGLRFVENIRKSWPARRLQKRTLFKVKEVRLMLNPNFLVDGRVHYELHEIEGVGIFGVYGKLKLFRELAVYSVDEMTDVKSVARNIESAISDW